MITTLLAMAAVRAAADPADARITAASMFKNGYAVVTREIDVPASGEQLLVNMPQASLGTLWITGIDGTKVESVVTTNLDRTEEAPIASLDGILRANVGKTLRFELARYTPNGESKTITGKLLSADGDALVIESAEGALAIFKNQITSVANPGGQLVYKVSSTSVSRALRFKTTGAGKISIVSLERGLTWAPGYAIDVTDKKTLSLIAKATVVNDLDPLGKIDARLITGFPNVPFATYLDPLISGQSVNDFLGMLVGIGAGAPVVNGQFRGADMMTQNAYGGFGGGGGAPLPQAPPPQPGEQREDLFFYKLPGVDLKKGERGYYVLFKTTSPYEDIYCWDLDDTTVNNIEYQPLPEGPGDVWHALQFRNTSGQPLTTAAATVFDNGEVIGQDMLKYVPAGDQAELKINKSLDIRAEASEAEIARERAAIKNRDGYPMYDLVTVKGTLAVTNMKGKDVKLRIRKDLTGEVVSVDGKPEQTNTAKGLTKVNPGARLVWTQPLSKGQKLELHYTYKLYVRSQ